MGSVLIIRNTRQRETEVGGWSVVLFVSGLTHLNFSSSEAASSSWDRSDLKSCRNAKSVTIVEVVETFSFPELTWTRTR